MADEANWAMTSSTGSTRYLLASPHPIGGAPFTRGINHAVPAPEPEAAAHQHVLWTYLLVLLTVEMDPLPSQAAMSSQETGVFTM